MSGGRPPRRRGRPTRPKGFEDASELTPEEVERRVEVRGGGTPQAPVERPVRHRGVPPPPRPPRAVGREAVLLVGLAIVGLVALRFLLPDGPLTAVSTGQPSGAAAAVASVVPPASGPSATPLVQTLAPLPSPSLRSATDAPTLAPDPTPTRRPGATPRPTPRPTPKPTTAPSPAHLRVTVVSTTDGGGTAVPSSWTVTVTSAGSASPASFAGSSAGTDVTLTAGAAYSVSVSGPAGYSEILTADCSSSTGGLPAAGAAEFCTVTEDDIKPKITVQTIVNGGDQVPGDWDVSVQGTVVSPSGEFPGSESGLVFRFNANQPYSVSQVNPNDDGYAFTASDTCASGGEQPGTVLVCTFTFTFTTPSPAAPGAWIVPLLAMPAFPWRRRWMTRPGN